MTVNPILIAVNPSHATDIESQFWHKVAAELNNRDWHLVQVAARQIPDVPFATTLIMPARLLDLAKRHVKLPAPPPIPWCNEQDLALLDDWEHRRWGYDSYKVNVRAGLERLAAYVDSVVRQLCPSAVITTNKIDHPCYLFRKAAQHYNQGTWLIERSPFDSIWLEPDGIFLESQIWERAKNIDESYVPTGNQVIQIMKDNPAGFRKDEVENTQPDLTAYNKPLILLPMDNVLWTGWEQLDHPQRLRDYPIFDTPQQAMQKLADIVESIGGTLLIKKHPSDRYITPDNIPTGARLIDGDLNHLINAVDAIVTFNTKLAYVGLSFDKPVVTLAPNTAAVNDVTYHTTEIDQIESVLQEALGRVNFSERHQQFKRLCGWLVTEYFYGLDGDPIHPLRPHDLVERIITESPSVHAPTDPLIQKHLLANLHDINVGKPEGVYEVFPQPPAFHLEEDIPTTEITDPLHVAFDMWRLAHTELSNARPTGITNYIRLLLDNFTNNTAIDLHPTIYTDLPFDNPKYHEKVRNTLQDVDQWGYGLAVDYPLRDASPDWQLYHSPVNPLPPRRLTGDIPRIITIHDVIHLTHPQYWAHTAPPQILNTLQSIDLENDYVVSDSEATRQEVLQLLPIPEDRVRVIYLSADQRYQTPQPEKALPVLKKLGIQPGSYLLALGQSEPRKNLLRVIRAFSQIKTTSPLLIVISSAEARDRLKAKVKAKGIAMQNVHFAVDIDDDTLAALYASAKLFIYTSLAEGFGIPILEAMSAGCPVLTSPISSMPEIAGEAGYYANPLSVHSIAAMMQTILALSPPARSKRIEQGKERAKLFSGHRHAQEVIRFYHDVLEDWQSTRQPETQSQAKVIFSDEITGPVIADLKRGARLFTTDKGQRDHLVSTLGQILNAPITEQQGAGGCLHIGPNGDVFIRYITLLPDVTALKQFGIDQLDTAYLSDISSDKLPVSAKQVINMHED